MYCSSRRKSSIIHLCAVQYVSGGIFDGVPETMFDPFKHIQLVRKNTANHPKIDSYLNDMKDHKYYGAYAMAKVI